MELYDIIVIVGIMAAAGIVCLVIIGGIIYAFVKWMESRKIR